MNNLSTRHLADEMNEMFKAGAAHLETCKTSGHVHQKLNEDMALFFYGAASGVLQTVGYDRDIALEACTLSLQEMKEKYNLGH